MNCLTCERKLKPYTSVPRSWATHPHENIRQQYHERVAQRQREIDEGKVGYLGEAEFCGPECASFYGRAAVLFMKHVSVIPDAAEHRIRMLTRLVQNTYPFVAKRKAGK